MKEFSNDQDRERDKHLKFCWLWKIIAICVTPMQKKQQGFSRSLVLIMQYFYDLISIVNHADLVSFLQMNHNDELTNMQILFADQIH